MKTDETAQFCRCVAGRWEMKWELKKSCHVLGTLYCVSRHLVILLANEPQQTLQDKV